MKKVCSDCGAEWPDHADYCNACGSERLEPVAEPDDRPPPAPVRSDKSALIAAAVLWGLGLGYFLGVQRPRDALDVAVAWGTMALITMVVGIALRAVRPFGLMALLAVPFFVLFAMLGLR